MYFTFNQELDSKKKMNFARRNSQYTPGLDNSGYSPKQWHPIILDKSMLETNPSTYYAKSHNRVVSNPTSIISFSSAIINKKPRWSIDQISHSTYGSSEHIQYD